MGLEELGPKLEVGLGLGILEEDAPELGREEVVEVCCGRGGGGACTCELKVS